MVKYFNFTITKSVVNIFTVILHADTGIPVDMKNIKQDFSLQGPSWPRILGRSDFSLQEN